MKTVNQLIDIGFQIPKPRSKKIIRLLAGLHDRKMVSGGLTKVENTDDILRIFALEKAKNIHAPFPEIETA